MEKWEDRELKEKERGRRKWRRRNAHRANRGTQREKTAGKTRKEKEMREMKGRKVDRRGGKRARGMAQQREEKEECMFASHLQWRRTA